MRGVVENGTGYPVNSEFVKIAGKTGTAQIPNLDKGGYYRHRFMASFLGFFPSDAPAIAGIVVLRNPRPVTYGGHTSGKAFRQIAERYVVSNPDLFAITERLCVEKDDRAEMTSEVPDFVGRDILQAKELARRHGVAIRCDATEGQVVWQYPAPDRLILCGDDILVAVAKTSDANPEMLNLKGLTIRRASAFLNHLGIKYTIEGSGRVAQQSIRPGQTVTSAAVCRLKCRPS
jgi:cell division protein FtsI (penicillin-binding protein 3)